MPRYRHRRHFRRDYGSYRAAQHIEARRQLSVAFGGIDDDIERIFFKLPPSKLQSLLKRYGDLHGASALDYACQTFPKWQAGTVRMSGMVAERLLNLVPPALDPATRFELIKKLRTVHLHQEHRHVECAPSQWRECVAPVIADLLAVGRQFQLPQHILNRVSWLANGDAVAAQQLLAAAAEEEAIVRLRHLETEFARIDFLIQSIEAQKSVSHTIELPQGTIRVCIAIPRKGIWQRLVDMLT